MENIATQHSVHHGLASERSVMLFVIVTCANFTVCMYKMVNRETTRTEMNNEKENIANEIEAQIATADPPVTPYMTNQIRAVAGCKQHNTPPRLSIHQTVS